MFVKNARVFVKARTRFRRNLDPKKVPMEYQGKEVMVHAIQKIESSSFGDCRDFQAKVTVYLATETKNLITNLGFLNTPKMRI